MAHPATCVDSREGQAKDFQPELTASEKTRFSDESHLSDGTKLKAKHGCLLNLVIPATLTLINHNWIGKPQILDRPTDTGVCRGLP